MQLPFVFGYVRILLWRQDLRSARYRRHGVPDCIADRCDILFICGESKCGTMAYYYKTLAILRNAKVDGVETSELDNVSKFLKLVEN